MQLRPYYSGATAGTGGTSYAPPGKHMTHSDTFRYAAKCRGRCRGLCRRFFLLVLALLVEIFSGIQQAPH